MDTQLPASARSDRVAPEYPLWWVQVVCGAGDAVRLQFTDSATDPASGVAVQAVVFQWLIPVPHDNRVTVVTFASANTEQVLVEGMSELFAAIADTFEYVAPAASDLRDLG